MRWAAPCSHLPCFNTPNSLRRMAGEKAARPLAQYSGGSGWILNVRLVGAQGLDGTDTRAMEPHSWNNAAGATQGRQPGTAGAGCGDCDLHKTAKLIVGPL